MKVNIEIKENRCNVRIEYDDGTLIGKIIPTFDVEQSLAVKAALERAERMGFDRACEAMRTQLRLLETAEYNKFHSDEKIFR